MRRRLGPTTALLTATLLLSACAQASTDASALRLQDFAAEPSRQVLLVTVDGLNPKAITELGRAGTPHLHRLLDEGAGTLNARTLVEETRTLPNHTGMLTGLRAALPKGSGVRVNSDTGDTLADLAGRYVPGIYDVVHDHGGSTGMFVTEDKFKLLKRSWSAKHGADDVTGPDDGDRKIDRFELAQDRDRAVTDDVVAELKGGPRTFTWLHLGKPDLVGHERGGMSPAYLDAVRRTDANVGRLLRAIDRSPGLRSTLTVILTADHGTAGRKHDDTTKRANYRVPFVAWGADVRAGSDLYDLNPGFARPGRKQLPYDGPQPIRNAHVGNLVASLLGLPPVPGSEFGVPVGLVVD